MDDLAVLELGDVARAFGPGLALKVVSDGDPATAADQDGTTVALVPPNRKRRPPPRGIAEFIAAAGPILEPSIKDPADAAPRRCSRPAPLERIHKTAACAFDVGQHTVRVAVRLQGAA